MFKISTPFSTQKSTYESNGRRYTSHEKGLMEIDEDPSLLTHGEACIAIPGESIANSSDWMRWALYFPCNCSMSSAGYIRGHGTYVKQEDVVASVSGLVERVNKLVSVRALRAK